MFKLTPLLLAGSVLFSSCASVTPESANEISTPPIQLASTPTTSKPPATTTTIQEVEAELPEETTTTTVFVDFADPTRVFSEALESDVVVTTESKKESKNYPVEGEVQWIPVGDTRAGPCENGFVLMASHLNRGEPHYNLVDDSSNDNHGRKDHGLVVDDEVNFELEDGTVCVYTVIEPIGQNLPNVQKIEGQPAIFFLKDSEIMNPILGALIKDVGDRPIVSMWVSYSGPNGGEFRTSAKKHRKYNAVVFAELTEISEK